MTTVEKLRPGWHGWLCARDVAEPVGLLPATLVAIGTGGQRLLVEIVNGQRTQKLWVNAWDFCPDVCVEAEQHREK
jgi:hypothetical protein